MISSSNCMVGGADGKDNKSRTRTVFTAETNYLRHLQAGQPSPPSPPDSEPGACRAKHRGIAAGQLPQSRIIESDALPLSPPPPALFPAGSGPLEDSFHSRFFLLFFMPHFMQALPVHSIELVQRENTCPYNPFTRLRASSWAPAHRPSILGFWRPCPARPSGIWTRLSSG